MLQEHTFEPIYNEKSRVLILGTLPSVKSRENGFYYGHPRNRFWPVLAAVFNRSLPISVDEKKAFLLSEGVALWDVVGSCDIRLSSDASIRSPEANNIGLILNSSPIEAIYANGKTAKKLYDRLLLPGLGREIIPLPSTSPANAAKSLDDLIREWSCILR